MQNQLPIIPTTAPVSQLRSPGFESLTEKEALYAYHFAQAAWEGTKICYFQKSYESAGLFYVFNRILTLEGLETIKTRLQWPDETLQKLYVYLAVFFENCGPFKSFGDSKFIPELPKEQFTQFVTGSPHFPEVKDIWLLVEQYVYAQEKPHGQIELVEQGGSNGYYSPQLSKHTIELVDKLLLSKNISELNTRVITQNNEIIVLVASAEKDIKEKLGEVEGKEVFLQFGDFAPFLRSVSYHLGQALQYVANEHQERMIKDYIAHFNLGCVEKHKDSQRHWIQDKGPTIETNIGFIESYMDPLKVRAEFEGFVAVVNKKESAVLNQLVDKAEEFIGYLPWPREFEIDKYKRPDFTSLEVVAFGCSGTPLGINIPNYDEIRQKDGFKNVSLGNTLGQPKKENILFLDEHDLDIFYTYFSQSTFLIVSLHELIGHGSGKLFMDNANGLNYTDVTNPLTGEKVTTHYKIGEQWHSKFGQLSSAYEECKADATALYLSTYDEIVQMIFPDSSKEERDKIVFGGWLFIAYRAVVGLEFYNVESKKWGQAHVAGRNVILQSLLRADPDIMKFHESELNGKPYLTVKFDQLKINTVGKAAIQNLILHLQVYKSTADGEKGQAFFSDLAQVSDQFLHYRNIILQNKVPRKVEIQPDLILEEGKVILKPYDDSYQGAIESQLNHHRNNMDQVKEFFLNNQQVFRID